MPLPKGVPETVPVECNGMRGMFHVRCQRVLHQDALIPAARFETLCGRGDAKKWKSSLWYVNEETKTAEMQMSVRCLSKHNHLLRSDVHQMWLSRVSLDRKMLFALRENYQDHEAYDVHVKNQVSGVLSRIVDSICGQYCTSLPWSAIECHIFVVLRRRTARRGSYRRRGCCSRRHRT